MAAFFRAGIDPSFFNSISISLNFQSPHKQLCHFIALSAVDRAQIWHLLSDACTKRHVSVLHVNAKIEVRLPGSVTTQFVPLKYKITRNSTGACEAEAIMDSLNSNFAGLRAFLKNPEDRFLTCVSSHTDNAPVSFYLSILRSSILRS